MPILKKNKVRFIHKTRNWIAPMFQYYLYNKLKLRNYMRRKPLQHHAYGA